MSRSHRTKRRSVRSAAAYEQEPVEAFEGDPGEAEEGEPLTGEELERLALQSGTEEMAGAQGRLYRCPDCGNIVSASATSCPHCGKPFAGQGWMLGCLKVVLILIAIAIVIRIFF